MLAADYAEKGFIREIRVIRGQHPYAVLLVPIRLNS